MSEKLKPVPLEQQLLVEGGVEKFIQAGRVPGLIPFITNTQTTSEIRGYFIVLPPEGTQIGDRVETHPVDVGVNEFFSPTGESRGFADLLEVSYEQGEEIKPRISIAIKKLLGDK